jgi:uncharacterized protein
MKQAKITLQPTLIAVHVTPKSGKNAVEGLVKDASGKEWLKVRLACVPEDGKANKALLKLLAETWDCPFSSLSIISGETSRHKIIRKD